VIDGEGWAFYRVVVSAMTEAGMEPMPTLRFAGYVEVAIREIGPACPWWLVFNEPSVSVLMETKMRSYELIKAANNDAMVSSNEATGNLPLPVRAGADTLFLEQVAESHLDFIGLDLYYPDITAEGMAQIDRRTPWPIFIIETGMPTDNGAPRPDGLPAASSYSTRSIRFAAPANAGSPSSGCCTGASPTTTNGAVTAPASVFTPSTSSATPHSPGSHRRCRNVPECDHNTSTKW
jgi:hypothetical protein